MLGLNAPRPQLAKDRRLIYAGYRDYVSYRWEEMFHLAEVYRAQYGNIWIPSNYITPQGKRLGEWISTQRTKYHGKGGHSRLTAKQLEKLESLGMIWDPYTLKWMLKYQDAQRTPQTAKLFHSTSGRLPKHCPRFMIEAGKGSIRLHPKV